MALPGDEKRIHTCTQDLRRPVVTECWSFWGLANHSGSPILIPIPSASLCFTSGPYTSSQKTQLFGFTSHTTCSTNLDDNKDNQILSTIIWTSLTLKLLEPTISKFKVVFYRAFFFSEHNRTCIRHIDSSLPLMSGGRSLKLRVVWWHLLCSTTKLKKLRDHQWLFE